MEYLFASHVQGGWGFLPLGICGKIWSVVSKRLWCVWNQIPSLAQRRDDDDDDRCTYSRPENCSEFQGSKFLLRMNYPTRARFKQLLSPALYIYWDTWKAAVINQVGSHIQHRTTWLLRFWASSAPCEASPTGVWYGAFQETRGLRITAERMARNPQRGEIFHSRVLPWNLFTTIPPTRVTAPICSRFVSACFRLRPGQHFTVTYLVDEWRLYRASFIMCPQ